MTRWSACIEMLFQKEHPEFPERIYAARDAGFDAVEFWATSTKIPLFLAIEHALESTGTTVAGVLAEPRPKLCDPTTHREFLDGLPASIAAAQQLGATLMIATTGDALPGVPRQQQHDALVAVYSAAADVLAGTGIVLAIEPLNDAVDHKGYYLTSTTEGLDIVDEVGRLEIRLLYDIYHSAMMGEDTATVLAGRVDRVAHVHLADAPGRHEPGTGAMDWRGRLAWLEANGYAGRVGLEYRPETDTLSSLAFIGDELKRAQ